LGIPAIDAARLDAETAGFVAQATQAVRAAPRSALAWGQLGWVLRNADFQDEAHECFVTAARLDGQDARWPYFRALQLVGRDPQAAVEGFRESIRLARDAADAPRLRLAQLLLAQGRHDEAGIEFRRLLASNRDHVVASLGLARLAAAEDRLDDAVSLAGQCLTDPRAARGAHALLAGWEARRGNAAAAQAASRVVATLPPDLAWPDPWIEEANRWRSPRARLVEETERALKHERLEEAFASATQLTKEYPDAPEGWLLLGRAWILKGDCPAAERALRRHLELYRDSVNGHFQLGVALLCQERPAEAAPSFEQALRLKPDFGEAHFNLGFARARLRQAAPAIQALRDALRCSPDYLDAYIILADVLHQTGERDEALSLLRRALEMNPADERAKALLARVQGAPP
jgi:tetratricopeptide (TPR) repeat protein